MICLKMDYVSSTEEENPRSRLNLPEYGVREARLFHKIRDYMHSLYKLSEFVQYGQSFFLKIFLIEENILSKKLLRYFLTRKPTRAKNSEIPIIKTNSFSPISINSI